MIKRILFLCTANSARSQMAEAILRRLGKDDYKVYSAGIEATRVNPLTIQVMEEQGYDLSAHASKNMDQFLGQRFDYVITVCSSAEERCPFFPGAIKRLHWPFDDPAAAGGNKEEKLRHFRSVRDQISEKITDWIAEDHGDVRPMKA